MVAVGSLPRVWIVTMWYKYLIIAVLLTASELGYFALARHFGIVDKPNIRSSHTKVTLRGGGIVFTIAVWLWAAFFGWRYPWFLIGLTLIAGVSFVDDIRSLPDAVRLVIQFAAMFMMFYGLGILQWRLWWVVLIAWVVCVGIINAYNFMDGINGMTGGYSLAVLASLIVLDLARGMGNASMVEERLAATGGFIDPSLLVVVALGALVFCFFNFRKRAVCFAGDVGAVGMAFTLVFAIGSLMIKTGDYSYIMLLAVYGVDTVLTIIHRILLHEDLGKAHRKHAYQLMANELKMPHVLVSGIYMALQLLVSAGLIFLPMNHYLYSAIVLIILCADYLLFVKKYYHLHEEYLASLEK